MAETLSRGYFENVYQANEDPWDFATSEYEKEKYRETLKALTTERYGKALEIGCSIGVQTRLLAERCDHLLAIDISEQAVERAAQRCKDLANVEFARLAAPEEYPEAHFDLTVVSEVGYYFSLEDLGRLADRIAEHLEPQGQVLLVHWLPRVPDYPLTGDQVHEYFLSLPEWTRLAGCGREKYRIDLLARSGRRSNEPAC